MPDSADLLPVRPALSGDPGLYVTGEDALRVTSFNSVAAVTLTIEGRFTKLDGAVVPFVERHVPNTDRSSATSLIGLAEGWLSNLQVRATGATPRRGQTFVLVELVRGSGATVQSLGTLLEGYVTDTSRRAWPGSPLEEMANGRGCIRSIVGTDPAANTEVSETVPTNARWRLIAVAVTLACDATVASRTPALLIDDGALQLLSSACAVSPVASSTTRLSWGAFGVQGTGTSNANNGGLPPGLILMGGFRIKTVTSNFQATDNYGAPQLWVEEWIED